MTKQRIKISDVVNNNLQPSQTKEEENKNNFSTLRAGLAGLTSGIVETPFAAASFVVNSPEMLYNLGKYVARTDDMKDFVNVMQPLAESKILQTGLKAGDKTRSFFGINNLEDLTPEEQIAHTAGEWLPTIGTFGTYGLVKTGANVAKAGGRAALKTLGKKGASLSKQKNLYKHGANITAGLLNMAVPGIQISKDAGLLGKTTQFITQAAPSLAGNELMHVKAENEGLFGDYSIPTEEDITLIKDKRKIGKKEFIDQLNPDLYKQYKLDKQINNEKRSKFLQNTLAFATVTGAGLLTARYSGIGHKISEKIKQKLEDASGYDLLSPEQKLDFAVADKYAFLDNLVKRNLLPEETRNAMYRDYSVIVDRVWNEGVLVNDDIKINLGVKPVELYNNLKNLTEVEPTTADQLNKFLENTRLIQDEAYRYNRENKKDISVNDYTKKVIFGTEYLKQGDQYASTYNRVLSNARFISDVYNTNPKVKKILNDLSTINNNLLKYYEENDYFTPEQIINMKNNRSMRLITVDEYPNGDKIWNLIKTTTEDGEVPLELNLYKQALSKPDTGIWSRFQHFINRASYSDNSTGYLSSASPRNITDNLKTSEDLINVIEQTIKSNVYNVEKNKNLNKVLESYSQNNMKQLQEYIDKQIDVVEDKWEEVETTRKLIAFDPDTSMDDYIKLLDEYNDLIKKTTKYVVKHFEAKYLGTKDIITSAGVEGMEASNIKEVLLSGLNNPIAKNSRLVENIKNNFDLGNPLSDISNTAETPGIIKTIKNGKLQIYKIDPLYAKALTLEPNITNVIGRGFYLLKNFQQSTLTGQFNPFFSGRSAIYTTNEGIVALPTISKLLNTGKITRTEYFKEIFKNIKNLYADEKAKYLTKWSEIYRNRAENIDFDYKTSDKTLAKRKLNAMAQSNAMQERLSAVLKANAENENLNLIHIMQDGGTVQSKPFNKTNERVVTLTNKTRITPKTYGILSKLHTPDAAKKIVDVISMMQNIIRDSPSLSINTLVYKKLKAKAPVDIQTNKIKMDQKMLDKMSYHINRNMANSALYGAGTGVLGSLSEFIRNYFSYGSVTINSLAPKLRASGLGKGIKNVRDLILKTIDKDVTYSDILDHMGMMYRSAAGNEYIKSLIYVSVIPSIISYIWNHGSKENIESYYSYSDSNKGSKFILTNLFGNGVHLVIPKDQEVALSDAIVYAVLDNTLHMSKYNEKDPEFKASRVVCEALARSMGLDGNPSLNIIANAQGYNFSSNVFDERFGITKLSKNVVNNDLTETAYQNGWANQQVTNIINNIFGTLGSALMLSAEEGKVGSRKDKTTAFTDVTLAFLDRTFGNSSFVPLNFDATRSSSATTQTVQSVYETRNLLDKISIIKDKTPEQEQIYNLIKMYNRNRIEPIKKQITELKQDITQIKANGRTKDGKMQSYYSRKNDINELNSKLKELFKNEFEEYNKLDNLIKQDYGNDISIDNFMEKFSYLGSK